MRSYLRSWSLADQANQANKSKIKRGRPSRGRPNGRLVRFRSRPTDGKTCLGLWMVIIIRLSGVASTLHGYYETRRGVEMGMGMGMGMEMEMEMELGCAASRATESTALCRRPLVLFPVEVIVLACQCKGRD
jgi:hypothetical protein